MMSRVLLLALADVAVAMENVARAERTIAIVTMAEINRAVGDAGWREQSVGIELFGNISIFLCFVLT